MPEFKEELLMMIKEGIIYLLNPHALFRVGLPYTPSNFYRTVNRLQKEGLVKKFRKEKKAFLRLTEKGRNLVDAHLADSQKFRAWDRKWRVVIFDIPENIAQLRLYLREYLKLLGFARVQKSVWISPYDFSEQVEQFSRKLKISDYVFQLIVNEFRGISMTNLAALFWDLNALGRKYLNLLQQYRERLANFQNGLESKTEYNHLAWKKYLANLLWDYHSIAAQDPHLPEDLLPPNWVGKKAYLFVEKCRAITNQIPFSDIQISQLLV